MQVLEHRGLRLLTIDSGGLQAISILLVLSRVCTELSRKAGHSTPLAPFQIFDIIAGVGTGGWLAILLGRYRLTIQQCMSVYFSIADAMDPSRSRADSSRERDAPFVLDQATLVSEIKRVVDEYKIGKTMLNTRTDTDVDSRQCYAFAIGVVRRAADESNQRYHLFRTYKATRSSLYQGPQPETCKVWEACAATTAASYLCDEYKIGETVYWDAGFPRTHNVSGIALDEAAAIYAPQKLRLDFVLSLSPGIPNRQEIKDLKKVAQSHSSTTQRVRQRLGLLRRAFTGDRITETISSPSTQLTTPGGNLPESSPRLEERSGIVRAGTDSSVSSQEEDKAHQDHIRERLRNDFGDDSLYLRLELRGDRSAHKPYLDDIAKPGQAKASVAAFLKQGKTLKILNDLVDKYRPSPEERQASQPMYISSQRSLNYAASSRILGHSPAFGYESDEPEYDRIVISSSGTAILGNVYHNRPFDTTAKSAPLSSRYRVLEPDSQHDNVQLSSSPDAHSWPRSRYTWRRAGSLQSNLPRKPQDSLATSQPKNQTMVRSTELPAKTTTSFHDLTTTT